ncbi:MAG TPA: hypothetical protein VIM98_10385 [Dyella sp.]|uniref:hypothetical protein n=1 Tax=Dyella sp. TaxID=1869338 RepID=UPI002F95DA82
MHRSIAAASLASLAATLAAIQAHACDVSSDEQHLPYCDDDPTKPGAPTRRLSS